MTSPEMFPALIGDEYNTGVEMSATVPYMLVGYDDYQKAHDKAVADAPKWIRLPNGARVDINGIHLVRTAHDQWRASLSYGVAQEDGMDGFALDFDIAAQTQKITQSLQTVRHYEAPGVEYTNYFGALGVRKTPNGIEVEGTDIFVPMLAWSQRYTLPDSAVSDDWICDLMNVVGHTNQGVFGTFPAGTVLQSGISGAKSGRDRWQISVKFAASKNVSDATIGEITGIAKGGWEFLQVHYEEKADNSSFKLLKRPVQVEIHKVYEAADFGKLQIPPRK